MLYVGNGDFNIYIVFESISDNKWYMYKIFHMNAEHICFLHVIIEWIWTSEVDLVNHKYNSNSRLNIIIYAAKITNRCSNIKVNFYILYQINIDEFRIYYQVDIIVYLEKKNNTG